jgi:hypothetical protein
VLALCRRLLAAGVDPGRPLCAYRGDKLSIAIRSIREGAAHTVDEHNGTRFAKWRAFPRSSVAPGIAPLEEGSPTKDGHAGAPRGPGAERGGRRHEPRSFRQQEIPGRDAHGRVVNMKE